MKFEEWEMEQELQECKSIADSTEMQVQWRRCLLCVSFRFRKVVVGPSCLGGETTAGTFSSPSTPVAPVHVSTVAYYGKEPAL